MLQPGPGGIQGGGLDVKGQHPALLPCQAAEKGGVPAVAAGGVDQQPGLRQMGREKILGQPHRRQVGLAAADQVIPLGAEIKLFPEGFLPRPGGQRGGEAAGLLPVIAPQLVEHLPQQVRAVAPPTPGRVDPKPADPGAPVPGDQGAAANQLLFFVKDKAFVCLNKAHKILPFGPDAFGR